MYYFPDQPPYFLLIAGFLAAVTSGSAFAAILKQLVRQWLADPETPLSALRGVELRLPYLAMVIGVGLFLAAGMQIFGFPAWFAAAIALPLTVLTAGLVWWQLTNVMRQIEQGGLKSLDLDSFV
ncbi:hypothetical protein [Synechococcus elongatus]|uniref:hypothetical protein n=1 Tax=Synechococcus elongatus TaxID=32046 RepID=UPI000F7E1E3B|nr:hypothetical protein [Synechococcus elongatus]